MKQVSPNHIPGVILDKARICPGILWHWINLDCYTYKHVIGTVTQFFTDWTNHPTLCFDSCLRQYEQKLRKDRWKLNKGTRSENIATARKENTHPVFNIFGY